MPTLTTFIQPSMEILAEQLGKKRIQKASKKERKIKIISVCRGHDHICQRTHMVPQKMLEHGWHGGTRLHPQHSGG
jgi:hydrogenase maturation factor